MSQMYIHRYIQHLSAPAVYNGFDVSLASMLSQKFIGTVGASSRHSRARGNPGFSFDFLDSGSDVHLQARPE
jgi:hypothetical protein